MKILWLTSWYPNPNEPVNGDFIQRHAEAVAELISIDVIHVLQSGINVPIEKEISIVNRKKNLIEYIYSFEFKPSGNKILDILRYNVLYRRYYKKIIEKYFTENGKPDLVHVHVPVKAGLAALYILKKFNKPYIMSEQSSHYEPLSPDYFFKRSRYYRYSVKRVFENAIAVTNVSSTIGRKLQSFFRIKNYYTIHNLVNTELFNYKSKQKNEKLRFIHVSAMGEQKNPKGIVEALALLKQLNNNWECIFCGPYNNELESLVRDKKLETHIHFTGEIKYERVAVEMQSADVFILFSNHENFPCVIIEALCCGLPVITSNAGGISEAINESNGLIVGVGNTKKLAEGLLTMMINIDKYDLKNISENAIRLYNKKNIADQFIELYKTIIDKNKIIVR
jgi:glycosyltransferase involved in cell wall biosynthesis